MKDERSRLNLMIGNRTRRHIAALQILLGGASMTEVVRRAVAVFEEIVEADKAGGRLIIETAAGDRERLVVR